MLVLTLIESSIIERLGDRADSAAGTGTVHGRSTNLPSGPNCPLNARRQLLTAWAGWYRPGPVCHLVIRCLSGVLKPRASDSGIDPLFVA
jgi:hypothetical protein